MKCNSRMYAVFAWNISSNTSEFPHFFVFFTNLKESRPQFFPRPLSLIASGRNHLPPHPPRPDARWCCAHVFAYSVCKPSKSDLCSCRRHLGAPSKETPERIKTGPGGAMRCPHGSLRIIVGMIIYVLFYSGSKYINTLLTIMALYFLCCLQS